MEQLEEKLDLDFIASNSLLSCVDISWYFSYTVSIIKEKD